MLKLLKKIHNDEGGSVSIETILIIAAVAIPILIFILKFGWPKIKEFFDDGMTDLEGTRENVVNGGTGVYVSGLVGQNGGGTVLNCHVAGTITGVIATQIVARIKKRYLSNKEFEALNIVDERDSEIDNRATFLTYKVTSIGSFLAMVTFVMEYPPLAMFVLFICSGLIGKILGDIYRLRLYSSN